MTERGADTEYHPVRADLPAHVAIIMDGNGRWARSHGWQRFRGHREGANSVREIIAACAEKGIRELTLFTFSTENWNRPRREVQYLMKILQTRLARERAELAEKNVRLKAIGRLWQLPDSVRSEVNRSIALTASNTGLVVRLALNYGGRGEIVDAARRMAEDVRKGVLLPEEIDEARIRRYLYDPEMTDPDLLIRTSGEMRVSNFLLWHLSYSELLVTPVCWPDFRRPQLEEALRYYAQRQRRFGRVPEAEEAKLPGRAGNRP